MSRRRWKEEGRLADCPLMVKAELDEIYKNGLFFELLSSTSDEIKIICGEINDQLPDSIKYLLIHHYNIYRILCVYMIYSIILRIGDIGPHEKIKGKLIYEFTPYLDESYYNAIRELSDKELSEFGRNLWQVAHWASVDIEREISVRLYDDVRSSE